MRYTIKQRKWFYSQYISYVYLQLERSAVHYVLIEIIITFFHCLRNMFRSSYEYLD